MQLTEQEEEPLAGKLMDRRDPGEQRKPWCELEKRPETCKIMRAKGDRRT